jgi:hypothetical protein
MTHHVKFECCAELSEGYTYVMNDTVGPPWCVKTKLPHASDDGHSAPRNTSLPMRSLLAAARFSYAPAKDTPVARSSTDLAPSLPSFENLFGRGRFLHPMICRQYRQRNFDRWLFFIDKATPDVQRVPAHNFSALKGKSKCLYVLPS